jgi:hypothetical protein
MDAYTLTSELAKAFAWPTGAVVIVLLLRKQLEMLIPLLKKVKIKDFEAEFVSETLERAEKTAAQALSPNANALAASVPAAMVPSSLAKVGVDPDLLLASPEAAILDTWQRFEQVAREAATRLKIAYPARASLRDILEAIQQHGLFADAQMRLFNDLSVLRNMAAHGDRNHSITVAAATRFLGLLGPLIQYFESLAPLGKDEDSSSQSNESPSI